MVSKGIDLYFDVNPKQMSFAQLCYSLILIIFEKANPYIVYHTAMICFKVQTIKKETQKFGLNF